MMSRPKGALPSWLVDLYPDPTSEPFWRAAREHRLVCQRCAACGAFRMPPAPLCHACSSFDAAWVDLPGTGEVYSFTVVRHAVVPAMREHLPYVITVVTLDGAPTARLITNIVAVAPEAIEIGMPVEVAWDDATDDATIPLFRVGSGH